MAKIRLDIDSQFNDSGLQQLGQGMKTVGNTVDKVNSKVGGLANAIGSMDERASKAVGAVNSVFNAFKSGNVYIAAAILAVEAVTSAINYFKQEAEEAKKRAEEFAAAQKKLAEEKAKKHLEEMSERLSQLKQHANEVVQSFKTLIDQQSKLASSQFQSGVAQKMSEIYKLRLEGLQAEINATTEEEKNYRSAQYKLRVAKEEQALEVQKAIEAEKVAQENEKNSSKLVQMAKEAEAQAIANVNKVQEEKARYENNLAYANKHQAEILENLNRLNEEKVFIESRNMKESIQHQAERERLQEAYNLCLQARAVDEKDLGKRLKEAQEAQKKAHDEVVAAENDGKIATEKLKQATETVAQKRTQSELQIAELTESEKKMKEAVDKEREKREEAARLKELQNEADKQFNKEYNDARDSIIIQIDHNEQKIAELGQSIDNLDTDIKKLDGTISNYNQRQQQGQQALDRQRQGFNGEKEDNAGKYGPQWDEARERAAQWEERNEASKKEGPNAAKERIRREDEALKELNKQIEKNKKKGMSDEDAEKEAKKNMKDNEKNKAERAQKREAEKDTEEKKKAREEQKAEKDRIEKENKRLNEYMRTKFEEDMKSIRQNIEECLGLKN